MICVRNIKIYILYIILIIKVVSVISDKNIAITYPIPTILNVNWTYPDNKLHENFSISLNNTEFDVIIQKYGSIKANNNYYNYNITNFNFSSTYSLTIKDGPHITIIVPPKKLILTEQIICECNTTACKITIPKMQDIVNTTLYAFVLDKTYTTNIHKQYYPYPKIKNETWILYYNKTLNANPNSTILYTKYNEYTNIKPVNITIVLYTEYRQKYSNTIKQIQSTFVQTADELIFNTNKATNTEYNTTSNSEDTFNTEKATTTEYNTTSNSEVTFKTKKATTTEYNTTSNSEVTFNTKKATTTEYNTISNSDVTFNTEKTTTTEYSITSKSKVTYKTANNILLTTEQITTANGNSYGDFSYEQATGTEYSTTHTPKISKSSASTLLLSVIAFICIAIICVMVFLYKRQNFVRTRLDTSLVPLLNRRRARNANICGDDIDMDKLEEYIKQCQENKTWNENFNKFITKREDDLNIGKLDMNKSKNRYNDVIPYDSTRVILDLIHAMPDSDYINANYIQGYDDHKQYIATQGPKKNTVNDFWRMVWQEHVEVIVMVTNLIDIEKNKCEQYWTNPDNCCGTIKVESIKDVMYMDYIHRYFHIEKNGITRQVEQFHFLTWPDQKIPNYMFSLVEFIRKIRKTNVNKKPLLVHCSAGIGRTGVIILCDYLIDMVNHCQKVNFDVGLKKLRDSRARMIQTEDQYKLVHVIVWAYFREIQLEPMPWSFREEIKKEDINKLIDSMYDILNKSEFLNDIMNTCSYDEAEVNNKEKIRYFNDVSKTVRSRPVFLQYYPVEDESSYYVYAYHAYGYMNSQFITTQQPKPNTNNDFWRLVSSNRVTQIFSLQSIDLNDESFIQFWPITKTENMEPVDYIRLEFINKEDKIFYDIFTINLINKNKNDNSFAVKIYSFKCWDIKHLVPHLSGFKDYYNQYEELNHGIDEKIILACSNGLVGCGLFLCYHFLQTMIKIENTFDILYAMRNTRNACNEFMKDKEQVEFLYKAAINTDQNDHIWIENEFYVSE